MSDCWCYECLKDIPVHVPSMSNEMTVKMTIPMVRFIVCPECGNKRCPRATDHRFACTDSNDTGQIGSRYGIYPHPAKDLLDFIDKKND